MNRWIVMSIPKNDDTAFWFAYDATTRRSIEAADRSSAAALVGQLNARDHASTLGDRLAIAASKQLGVVATFVRWQRDTRTGADVPVLRVPSTHTTKARELGLVVAKRTKRVEFNAARFERAHGRSPRGAGDWAFIDERHADADDYLLHVFWFNGLYTAAKRAAADHFVALGVEIVAVLS